MRKQQLRRRRRRREAEQPPTSLEDFNDEAAASTVEGNPKSVWLVCCGDRGCTYGYLKAFLSEAEADAAAVKAYAENGLGLSFYAVEADVE